MGYKLVVEYGTVYDHETGTAIGVVNLADGEGNGYEGTVWGTDSLMRTPRFTQADKVADAVSILWRNFVKDSGEGDRP